MNLFNSKNFFKVLFIFVFSLNLSITKVVYAEDFSTYVVQPGDNVYRISLKYNISQQKLLDMNNIKDSNIKVGQKLKVPSEAEQSIKKQNETKKSEDNKTSTANNADNEVNENVKKVIDVNTVKQQEINSQITNTTFIWPTRGKILTKFGYQTNTGKLEGVNIGCENDSAVRASASGEVVYNDKVDGFGNVILIRHYNGFFTAYGYTDPLVANKDKVKKGQIIGRVLKSSKSKRSILYFSIRKNGKSFDPEKLIQIKISN